MGEDGTIQTKTTEPWGRAPGPVALAMVLALGTLFAFVFPFLVPVGATPIYSTAWVGGADNRVATVGLALLCCAVVALTVLRNRGRQMPPLTASPAKGLSTGWLLAGALPVLCWTLFWGLAIVHSGLRVGETNYFLEQTRNAAGIGLAAPMRIYRDLEFPYGPLLLEPPVWLWRLVGGPHLSIATCYVLTLAVWNVLGLVFVWFSLNRLPLGRVARRVLFLICVAETLHPLFGPNYSLGKFAFPIAALLWAGSIERPFGRTLAFTASLFLSLMISPELTIALSAAILTYCCARAVRTPSAWAEWLGGVVVAILLAYGGFLLLYGSAFMDRLRHASGGALNLVIQPMPDMLVFCLAVLWLAPVSVGLYLAHFRAASTTGPVAPEKSAGNEGPMLLALLVLALGLLPGALGRSDPLHVFFNGLPFLILSMISLDRFGRSARLAWIAALLVLALQVEAANYEMYARSLVAVVRAQRHPLQTTFDVARLSRETGGEPVAAPVLYGISIPDELAMRQAHLLVLDPAPGLAEIWDARTEQSHIARLRQSDWALMPTESYLITEHLAHENHVLSGSLPKRLLQSAGHSLLGFNYPERHRPFSVGALTEQEIATNWSPVERFGSLELYRRVR